jgi:hypothetical protein
MLKGAIFPKKQLFEFSGETAHLYYESDNKCKHNFADVRVFGGGVKLVKNISEILMWYYIPFAIIGLRLLLADKGQISRMQSFVPKLFFILNIAAVLWLYSKYGYMSYRHNLAIVLMLVFYISAGMGLFIEQSWKKAMGILMPSVSEERGKLYWFAIIFICGICICLPKDLTPLRIKKQGFQAAAEWINANTVPTELIAVPDIRISFYANRPGRLYEGGDVPVGCKYVVLLDKKNEDGQSFIKRHSRVVFNYISEKKGGADVRVLQILPE